MVDYSCAMKLAAPIAVLTAMKEAAGKGISVKGGKFLEEAAKADAVVFDKTGTLTNAAPVLSRVIAFDGRSKSEILRTAACLEEHFVHPVACGRGLFIPKTTLKWNISLLTVSPRG